MQTGDLTGCFLNPLSSALIVLFPYQRAHLARPPQGASKSPGPGDHSASISLVPGTSPPFLHPHRAANARGPSLTGCTHCECVFEHGVHLCVCWHVLVCVCGPFSTPLGPLICFGSVWWAGHEANYLLKGKSEPNEPQRATELTGLIKHSVCFSGRLPLEAAAWAHTLTPQLRRMKSTGHANTKNRSLLMQANHPPVSFFLFVSWG